MIYRVCYCCTSDHDSCESYQLFSVPVGLLIRSWKIRATKISTAIRAQGHPGPIWECEIRPFDRVCQRILCCKDRLASICVEARMITRSTCSRGVVNAWRDSNTSSSAELSLPSELSHRLAEDAVVSVRRCAATPTHRLHIYIWTMI